MKIPKYKPTKWKVNYCLNCKQAIGRHSYYCSGGNKHEIVERDNVPFFIKEIAITGIGYKGWASAISKKPEHKFDLSPTNLEKIILGCGIGPKGVIKNQWWMFCKLGSSTSLKWLPIKIEEEDEK